MRRRRRDLAVLRTLGFQRSQVRTTVACQASTYAVLSLLVGIPLDIAVGRLIWRAIAENLGIVPAFSVSALALLILVISTILVLNLIGAFAARSAIQMRPASVLRTE
jgi:ABC-type antimicrobial peptide transport system permease subunit